MTILPTCNHCDCTLDPTTQIFGGSEDGAYYCDSCVHMLEADDERTEAEFLGIDQATLDRCGHCDRCTARILPPAERWINLDTGMAYCVDCANTVNGPATSWDTEPVPAPVPASK